MVETWVRPNRRALALGMVLPALVTLIASWCAWSETTSHLGVAIRLLATILVIAGALVVMLLVMQMWQARVAFRDGWVLLNLRSGPPLAIPVDLVEAFFLGQGPAHLPSRGVSQAETVNLIARVAQRADQWQHVDVKPSLGHWCDGYITIRGTWCEPLHEDLVRDLNRRLADARRRHVATRMETDAP